MDRWMWDQTVGKHPDCPDCMALYRMSSEDPKGARARLAERPTSRGAIAEPIIGGRATWSLGRKAIGIEIEERYCEIAAQRCAQEVLGLVG